MLGLDLINQFNNKTGAFSQPAPVPNATPNVAPTPVPNATNIFQAPGGSIGGLPTGGFNDFYGPGGLDITGKLPATHTEPGSGLALVNDSSLSGLTDYYIGDSFGTPNNLSPMHRIPTGGFDTVDLGNLPTLQNYLHGTYFDEGKNIPGTNIGSLGDLNNALFGNPYDWQGNYDNFTADKLLGALGTNPQKILEDARDWEIREVVRGNNSGFATGGLLGALGVSAILAPAVLTGSGLLGGQGFVNPNALGIGPEHLYNPTSLGGIPSSPITGLSGGPYIPGGGFINPGALGGTPDVVFGGLPPGAGVPPTPPSGGGIQLPDWNDIPQTPGGGTQDPTPPTNGGGPDFPRLPDFPDPDTPAPNPGDTGNTPPPSDFPDLPFPIPPIPPGGVSDTPQPPQDDPDIPIVVPNIPSDSGNDSPDLPDIPASPLNMAINSTMPYSARYMGKPPPGPADLMTYFSRFQDFEEPEELLSINPFEWMNPYV